MLLDSLLGRPAKLATSQPNRWRLTDVPGQYLGVRKSASGATVNDDDALSLSAIFAGVSLLAEIMAMLPASVYRRESNGGKVEADQHPAYRVLHTAPNPWMTPPIYKEVMEWNRRMGGCAYAEIQWTTGGNVAAVWPIAYWRVRTKWNAEKTDFVFLIDGKREVPKEDMIHVPLFTWNGVDPCGFLDYAVESIGLGLTVQQAAAYSFANDARPGGYVTHKGSPTEPQREEFRKTLEKNHAGQEKRGTIGIFWGGWEYHDTTVVTPEQQQALESRRYSVEEASRWLRIPPHFLSDLSRATFSNIEHQGIELVVYTASPMTVKYEAEYNKKLLNPPNLYCKYNLNALMRGDSAARSEFYQKMAGIGVLSINEICELEDFNPIGPLGDTRYVPANMMTLENSVKEPQPAPAPAPPGEKPAPKPGPGSDQGGGNKAMQAWTADIFSRMLGKEANAANRAAAKPEKFLDWMDDFYAGHVETIRSAMIPVAAQMSGGLSATMRMMEAADQHVKRSRNDLLDLTGKATTLTLAPLVAQLMIDWKATRPAEQAADFFKGEEDATST